MFHKRQQYSRLLLQLRLERNRTRARQGSHPLSHVDPDKCYEWMRSECAAHDVARQAREDGLIATITQISSAAILAIPGLLFGSSRDFPSISESPWLYVGTATFLFALVVAMVEQYCSAKAYRLQSKIAQDYYTMKSEKRNNSALVPWVGRLRNLACIAFASAVIITASALMTLKGPDHGKPTTTATTATTAATAATATATAPSSPTALSSKSMER